MAGGPGQQTAPDIRQSKAAGAGYAEEGTCPPKGAASQDAFELPHLSQEPLDDRKKNASDGRCYLWSLFFCMHHRCTVVCI